MKKPKRTNRFLTKFDVLIIVAVLFGFTVLGVSIKFIFQKDTYITVELLAAGGEWWWGTPPPFYWNADPIEKGAIEYDTFRKPLVEILDVTKYDVDTRKFMWIKARIKARKNVLTGVYNFHQSQVQVGKMITISPNNITIIGHIISIEGMQNLGIQEERIVHVKIYDLFQWQADTIQIGDVITNNKDESIAEILDKRVEPMEVVTHTYLGEPLLKRDPLTKLVTIKLKLTVQNVYGTDYFMYYQQVKEGHDINLPLMNTTTGGLITKVLPYSEESLNTPLE